jgi:Rieske Fe-S protein
MSDQPADCVGCGIGRRDFLSSAALALLASSLASACGDGQIGGVTGPVNPPGGPGGLLVRLADFPALATVGGIARVDGGSSNPVAAVRLGPSSFAALSMICPHAGFRPIQITSPGFRCPNHGAEFAPAGDWVGGQRTSDLPRFNVAYDAAAGTLTIT